MQAGKDCGGGRLREEGHELQVLVRTVQAGRLYRRYHLPRGEGEQRIATAAGRGQSSASRLDAERLGLSGRT